MTAVAALVENGKVYMGGDSAGVGGYSLTVRKDTKVFINGPFIISFTSSYRMGQLLRYSFKPPTHPSHISTEEFIHTIFIDEVRHCLREGAFTQIKSNEEHGGTFLVGYKGQLYYIDGDFQVGESMYGFDAAGCGHDLCKGSLHSTGVYDIGPEKRLEMALEAAEAFSAGVRGPFTIMSL